MRRVLVTGGAGFIGSWLVRHLLARGDVFVLSVDKLTYAADHEGALTHVGRVNYHFELADICDAEAMKSLVQHFSPGAIMHLAAESHVDRSIDDAGAFIQTNILGTYILLQTAKSYWSSLPYDRRLRFRFHHISTDEVFGSLGSDGYFTETTPYRPNSPYSASKAGSDHLARAWHSTYGLPVIITNCSNNYGPHQFPEKLIPLIVAKALLRENLPVYGRGENVRDWLYVEDHVRALIKACFEGQAGQTYNIGGDCEKTNLEVVESVCDYVDELSPSSETSRRSLITFVPDRPGHDYRYAMDTSKIKRELGWSPLESFESGLRKTVRWYVDNVEWWQRIRARRYNGERLGIKAAADLPPAKREPS